MSVVTAYRRGSGAQIGPRVAAAWSGPSPTPQPAATLWLHLHFPQLALEVLTRGAAPRTPCVLAGGEGSRRTVALVNAQAATAGIRPGLPLAAAYALAEFTLLERNPRAERRALERLGLWAMQFSPQVSPVPDDGLLVEIKGSLRLFGGLDGLLERLRQGCKALGYRVQYAVAPTPLAATVLARAGTRVCVLERHELAPHLAALPLSTLRLAASELTALASVGVQRIGECRRLPRDGLARRCTPVVVECLDRLYGQRPDPRAALPLPRVFESTLELPWEVRSAPALLIAAERLLHELSGYLRASAALTRRLRWRLRDRDHGTTRFDTRLSQPGRDVGHMLVLLRETLARMRLPAPVHTLELSVDELVMETVPVSGELFAGGQQASGEAYAAFVDRMRSRCGEAALRGLDECPDHRPEHAWSWRTPGVPRRRPPAGTPGAPLRHGARPLWLIRQPLPLPTRHGRPEFDGPLELRPERERIDGGWWEAAAIARDYFIATTTRGGRLWIYRELAGERRWLLHGVFD